MEDDQDRPNQPPGGWQPSGGAGGRGGPPGGGPPDEDPTDPSDSSSSESDDRKKKKKKEKKVNASDYLKKKFGELPIKEEPEDVEEKKKKTMRDLRNSLSGFQQGAGVDLVGLIEAIGKITKPDKVDSTKDLTLPDYHRGPRPMDQLLGNLLGLGGQEHPTVHHQQVSQAQDSLQGASI